MIKSTATDLEVSLHDACGLIWAKLLELLAGSSLVAGKMMDGADAKVALPGEVSAALSGWLWNHCQRVLGIQAAIRQYCLGINYKDIQEMAALTAS
jgi:hypothetical protein